MSKHVSMIKTRLYLDSRKLDKEGKGTLYFVLSKNGTSAMSSLGIKLFLEQWENGKVIKHTKKDFLNRIIDAKKGDIEKAIIELSYTGIFTHKSAKECVQIIKEYLDPEFAIKNAEEKERRTIENKSFLTYYSKHLSSIDKPGTHGLYMDTYNKIKAFCSTNGKDAESLLFDDINKNWLVSFENFCLKTQRQNTASRHLRDIRAVINAAIDDGITTNYPFRRFKIKKEETIDKSFTASELRSLFNYICYEGGQQEAVDMFKLMFCLIGINSIDLARAPEISSGRLNYIRAKTHKPYSIKIEPEAQMIINKYKGSNGYLLNILERVPNYKTYFNRLAKTLRKVGLQRVPGKKNIGEALLPDICTGSARTSWATIAQEELDIPRDVIAAALGHHTVDVTSTYLRTDWKKKVDAANRKVLDWVLYGKKTAS